MREKKKRDWLQILRGILFLFRFPSGIIQSVIEPVFSYWVGLEKVVNHRSSWNSNIVNAVFFLELFYIFSAQNCFFLFWFFWVHWYFPTFCWQFLSFNCKEVYQLSINLILSIWPDHSRFALAKIISWSCCVKVIAIGHLLLIAIS